MKKQKSIYTISFFTCILVIITLFLFSCSKEDTPPSNVNSSGEFTYKGTNYSGTCASIPSIGSGCSGLDVLITTTSGSSFIVYNIPAASSGTYNFTDGYQNVYSCKLYGAISVSNSVYSTKNGTITKTSANSFTFSCTVYDLLTNASYNVTGKGNY
jgi:hypothetical protein